MRWIFIDDEKARESLDREINPCSGLPMLDGALVDVAGNLYGASFNEIGSGLIDNSFDTGGFGGV